MIDADLLASSPRTRAPISATTSLDDSFAQPPHDLLKPVRGHRFWFLNLDPILSCVHDQSDRTSNDPFAGSCTFRPNNPCEPHLIPGGFPFMSRTAFRFGAQDAVPPLSKALLAQF